jgi:hypothetical protein
MSGAPGALARADVAALALLFGDAMTRCEHEPSRQGAAIATLHLWLVRLGLARGLANHVDHRVDRDDRFAHFDAPNLRISQPNSARTAALTFEIMQGPPLAEHGTGKERLEERASCRGSQTPLWASARVLLVVEFDMRDGMRAMLV